MPQTRIRFDALTGLRWLAASMVFVYHNRKYWRADVPKPLLLLMNEMDIGVAVFFVLSGFLIGWTYQSKPLVSGNNFLKYAGLRAARILPVYWLILTARYIDYGFPKGVEAWLTYPLLQGFTGKYNLAAIAQSWTLSVEMTFYLLAPLIYFLWDKGFIRMSVWVLSASVIAILTGYCLYWLNGNHAEILYPFSFVQGATFFGRFPEFLAGMWLARALQNNHFGWLEKIPRKTWTGFAGLWVSLYLLALCEPDIFSHGASVWQGKLIFYTLIPFFITLWIAGLIREETWLQKFLGSRPLVLLGNASFAFYLVHLSYVNIRLRGWILWPDRNYLFLWLISILLYLCFEKPVYQFVRRKLYGR